MGCEGLLAKPWNVQVDDVLREFKFEGGNQWIGTKRRDPDNWTPDTWARVYGFHRGIGEGWAGRKDGLFTGKFKGEVDAKKALHPANYRNPRERRVLEFLMPIFNLEKSKRITLTMAKTLFEALSRVWPVNWGMFIHEVVAQAIPYIGRKPSYLPPSLCTFISTTSASRLMRRTIAAEEVAYTSTSSDPIILKAPPSSHESPPLSFWRPNTPPSSPPHHHPEAGPRPDTTWRNVDLFAWNFRKILSSGSTMSWRISRPSITG